MKFGHEYEAALAAHGFPDSWLHRAIEYKALKKCINQLHRELRAAGLDAAGAVAAGPATSPPPARPPPPAPARPEGHDRDTADESTPQRRVVVDDMAEEFFRMLEPRMMQLDDLRAAETRRLERDMAHLGAAVDKVVQPACGVSHRDLYLWREMFRLYLEKPVFYADTERRRGALTYREAQSNLDEYRRQLRHTGLLARMKTPPATAAAQAFLDLNLHILAIMHFQEMNARAAAKIVKKFHKRTRPHAQPFTRRLEATYPALATRGATGPGGFADSIARDLHAAMGSRVLAVVPQPHDWACPVCYGIAWRPVHLRCCAAVFCIRCVIRLQDSRHPRCPACNAPTVMRADATNLHPETTRFLHTYFPVEVRRRQKENEKAQLARRHGDHFVHPACSVM